MIVFNNMLKREFQVPSFRFQVPGFRFQVPGFRFQVPGDEPSTARFVDFMFLIANQLYGKFFS